MKIYKITNSINDKVYVGQTTRDLHERIASHKYCASNRTHNLPIYNAMAKYGFDNFKFEEIDSASSIEELNKKEEQHISQLDTVWPNGYNLDRGGRNKCTSAVTRKKQSESRKKLLSNKENHPNWGKTLSAETCKKMGDSHRGKTQSEEHKRKNSEANSGEKNGFFGKIHSEETKQKMSKSKKGHKNPNLGLSKRRKVFCLNTGTVYDSVKIAALNLNISRSGIAMTARGEQKQIKGFRFKYL